MHVCDDHCCNRTSGATAIDMPIEQKCRVGRGVALLCHTLRRRACAVQVLWRWGRAHLECMGLEAAMQLQRTSNVTAFFLTCCAIG